MFQTIELIKILFHQSLKNIRFNGGEGGIRTHERVAPLLVFKTSAFNRSATSPKLICTIYYYQSREITINKYLDFYWLTNNKYGN